MLVVVGEAEQFTVSVDAGGGGGGVVPVTCTGQLADLDCEPEVTVRLAVYTPDVGNVLTQDVPAPEHAPDHV